MKIKQEKTLTITLETKEEYVAFCQIVDEATNVNDMVYMDRDALKLSRELSNYFSNDV